MITKVNPVELLSHINHLEFFVGHLVLLDAKLLELVFLPRIFLGQESVFVFQLVKLMSKHRDFIVKFLDFWRCLACLVRMSYQVLFLFGNKTLCPLLLFLKVVDISLDLLYYLLTVSYLLPETPAVLLILHPLFFLL